MRRRELLKALGLVPAIGIPEVQSVEVAKVGPDDVIVISSEHPISMEQSKNMVAILRNAWPEPIKIVVLSENLSLKVVRQ